MAATYWIIATKSVRIVQREWREAIDVRSSPLGISLVLIWAAVLRFWNLRRGIPYAVGIDEPEIVVRAVHMMKTGDFNPHFFDYPGLYIYVQLAVACARFVTGATAGMWRSLDQFGPADVYLWGRVVTALLGTMTVYLVFLIGHRWGARHALLAAGLMAVVPPHVRESHYVLTDVPMTFLTTLTFLLSLRAHEKGTVASSAWAGAAAGLAAGVKYNGALAIVAPLLAVWMTRTDQSSRTRRALAVTAAFIVAFIVAAPYTFLSLPEFLNSFGNLAALYSRSAPPGPAWLLYLKHLRLALGWPASLLTIAGLILAVMRAVRGPERVKWTVLVSFPVFYFYVIATRGIVYGRYMLPLLPLVCVMASVAVISGISLLRRFNIPRGLRTALITGLTIAAVLPPTIKAIAFDRRIARISTVDLAYQWITRHIPDGSKIAVERRALILPEARYKVGDFKNLVDAGVEAYASRGYQYFIASSDAYGPVLAAPQKQPELHAAYRKLFDRSDELFTISPSDEHPGPELRIFRFGSHPLPIR